MRSLKGHGFLPPALCHRATNVKKLPGNRPCNDTNQCFDCRSPHRGCAVMQIMMFQPMTERQVEVLLVDEELGF